MRAATAPWPRRVRAAFDAALGGTATLEEGFGPVAVDVPADRWLDAVGLAREGLGCGYFDWLSAVDELADGFRVVCHLADHRVGEVDHLVLRTLVPREAPRVASVGHLFGGARWHERETHEMFGIDFTVDDEPLAMAPLLLPESFEGHPLRKDFVLASRVAKPWPGAKEPGESDDRAHDSSPARRRTRPPGVPEPEQWGPRAPGTDQPDPLAVAGSAAPRPRRTPRARSASDGGGGAAVDGPGSPATKERGRMDAPPSTGDAEGKSEADDA